MKPGEFTKRLCATISRYGVVPRKSLNAEVKHLENSVHFWRGCIDSDGWVCLTTNRGKPYSYIGFTGGMRIVEQFAVFAGLAIGMKPLAIHPNGSIWRTGVAGSKAAELLTLLYQDGMVALPRKAAAAKAAIGISLRLRAYCRATS